MAGTDLIPTDAPSAGPVILGAGALGMWLWQTFRKVKVDVNTDKLFDQSVKDRQDLRSRIKELEDKNDHLQGKLVELSGSSGGASASVMQMQQRLLAVEKALRDSENAKDQARLEMEDAERTIDMLTIHLVRMSFCLSALKGELPEDSMARSLAVDLPEVLNEIQRRKGGRPALPPAKPPEP